MVLRLAVFVFVGLVSFAGQHLRAGLYQDLRPGQRRRPPAGPLGPADLYRLCEEEQYRAEQPSAKRPDGPTKLSPGQGRPQPNLVGAVTGTYTHSKNANPVIGGFQTQSSFASDYSRAVSGTTIYNGNSINNNIKMANLQIQSANQTVIENELDITLQIVQDYLNILLAKENVVYVEDLVKSTTAQVDQGKQEYEVGTIAKNAYIELLAQLATDKYTLVTAQNAVRQNKVTLKQLLQLPIPGYLRYRHPRHGDRYPGRPQPRFRRSLCLAEPPGDQDWSVGDRHLPVRPVHRQSGLSSPAYGIG